MAGELGFEPRLTESEFSMVLGSFLPSTAENTNKYNVYSPSVTLQLMGKATTFATIATLGPHKIRHRPPSTSCVNFHENGGRR